MSQTICAKVRLVHVLPDWGECKSDQRRAGEARTGAAPHGAFVEFLAKEWRIPPWAR
ncbi:MULTISPECIES: hypothetical protein [Rhizobium/Agrobacterium group]|uniref:Uncharacterized protein n=1 Tax=Agrobacterium pusense TaxID=648995 RepID=A0AA44EGU4_9HYPH|nr:hypothetical protein [Agrobacterium pusense]NRF07089.1 hypothetical protein [Agrobacterium pusense]NRF17953.1 hypothetical protein [Agrobacterium pusense]